MPNFHIVRIHHSKNKGIKCKRSPYDKKISIRWQFKITWLVPLTYDSCDVTPYSGLAAIPAQSISDSNRIRIVISDTVTDT